MKTILYMSVTANGYIATKEDGVDWISKASWRNYLDSIKKMDAVIIGRRTYDLMPRKEFQKNCLYVVLTHKKLVKGKIANMMFTGKSPEEIISFLKKKGFKKVCVAGGGKTNASFVKASLIDEIYLDVEPIILGKGIQLFSPNNFETKLKLLRVRKLNRNAVQLHYKVLQ
ncbi:MAG: dihydrofolate reductase [Candidatus Colwellbacteria bacterium]|nr:dihydrofolate reductase [Candidatus Colwellbacteria bacterium]